jgi:leucyl aminopeptidase
MNYILSQGGGSMKKLFFLLFLLLISLTSFSKDNFSIISVDSDVISRSKIEFGAGVDVLFNDSGIAVLKIEDKHLPKLSHIMHADFGRCPGYILHDSVEDAVATLTQGKEISFATKRVSTADYDINQQERVTPMLKQVSESKLTYMIKKLSSYRNRYHTSKTGRESVAWLKGEWTKLTQHRNDIRVDSFKHRKTSQLSTIITVEGTEFPEEIIVVGGHIDSIAGFLGRNRALAPGADDNASGISTITEVVRILMQNEYRPRRTLQFIAYAAEEVGLRGSGEIATQYKREGKNVVGVLQLDMTNYKGSEWDIVFMRDFTNSAQNSFLGSLVDTYVNVKWGYDKCGYGCSDHASWSNNGFIASIPFEAKMHEYNKKIHTSKDTFEASGGTSLHSVKFAKLALSYVIELDQ